MNTKDVNKNASALMCLCWSIYAVCYIGRKNLQACIPAMIENGYSAAVLGMALTGYLISYAAGQFVSGIVGDKISPKYMIFVGLCGVGCANLAMGLNSIPVLFVVFWCFNGLFNSMLWSPVIRAYATWLSEAKRHAAALWISATIPTGAICSTLITSFILKHTHNNWRIVFYTCAAILFVMAIIWFFGISFIKKYIDWIEEYNKKEKVEKKIESNVPEKKYTLWHIIMGGGLLCVLFGILFNGVLKDAVDAWTSTYIYDFFGTSASDAALVTTILPIVNLSGAFIANYINERLVKNEITTSGILFAASVVSIGLLLLIGKYSMILAVVLIGITTACMLGANTMFLTFIPLNFASTGRSASLTGFFNSCSYAAAAVAAYFIGLMASMENVSWNFIIFTWLVIAFLGTLSCFVGRNFYAKNKNNFN